MAEGFRLNIVTLMQVNDYEALRTEGFEIINSPRRFPASARGNLPISLASLPCITPIPEIEDGRFGSNYKAHANEHRFILRFC